MKNISSRSVLLNACRRQIKARSRAAFALERKLLKGKLYQELKTKLLELEDVEDKCLEGLRSMTNEELLLIVKQVRSKKPYRPREPDAMMRVIKVLREIKVRRPTFTVSDILDIDPSIFPQVAQSMVNKLVKENAITVKEKGRGRGQKSVYEFINNTTGGKKP